MPETLYETLNHIVRQVFNQGSTDNTEKFLIWLFLISTNAASRQHNIIALQKASILQTGVRWSKLSSLVISLDEKKESREYSWVFKNPL